MSVSLTTTSRLLLANIVSRALKLNCDLFERICVFDPILFDHLFFLAKVAITRRTSRSTASDLCIGQLRNDGFPIIINKSVYIVTDFGVVKAPG